MKKNKRTQNRKTLQNLNEFISVFTYFKIYLKNGLSVYDSLLEVRQYCSPWMYAQFDILINEIDGDKSILPYMNFAKKFNNNVVEEIMITIYQMVDDGTNYKYLSSFTYIFDEFKKNIETNNIEKENRSMGSKTTLCLIGSAIFTLAIMLGVIGMLGATLSGI
jgi:hypothetical protein